ncbi:MAG: DUF4338 domain-containing protein [Dehalococcoidia bacterium]
MERQNQTVNMDDAAVDFQSVRNSLLASLNSPNGRPKTKDIIRHLHEAQRRERAMREKKLLEKHGNQIIPHFAEGKEVEPLKIDPELIPIVKSDSLEGRLFRAATLLWSVPVSHGYGRRIRYLVIDRQNSKLVGIIGLGDPVFNLKCRDEWINWNAQQRRERLSYVFDAYVLGAVPPYSLVLGAKLIGSLVAAEEIRVEFRERYAHKEGLISKRIKEPHLVLITTTSALGRSSVYNRLRLPGNVDFIRIGTTEGWGHFTVSDELFRQVRAVLRTNEDPYFDNYKFGQGPSWRLRALRQACSILGIDQDLLRHGIRREVYAIPLATNWREILLGKEATPEYQSRNVAEIAIAALNRWVIPRSETTSDWAHWNRQNTWDALTGYVFETEQIRESYVR